MSDIVPVRTTLAPPWKLRPPHLMRSAILYVRQSSVAQVQMNLESQRRQYGLRERLVAWGWRDNQIVVIDEDQGRSGSESQGRPGFQRLLAEVALGKVGILISLETSRIARNSEDWRHLLNICAVVDTLVADAEDIYDLRIHNDRLLLGLKGDVSEYELHMLQQRLNAGVENKARRGELWQRVPPGFVLSEEGQLEMSPDDQVRSSIHRVFELFRQHGTASHVVLTLHLEGALLPRNRDGLGRKGVDWRPPTRSFVQSILGNPVYAGAYAWGRGRTEILVTNDGQIQKRHRKGKRPPEEWGAFQVDHHPGYVTWAEYQETQRRLTSNRRAWDKPGPVGQGTALLAGMIRCGYCGHKLTTHYSGADHRLPHYQCNRLSRIGEHMACQSFGGKALENAVEEMVLGVLEPGALDAALLAERDLERQKERETRRWDLEVERAEEAEARARRKFEEVEPGHRMVSRELERRWEGALKAREEARHSRETHLANLPPPLTSEEKHELRRAVSHVGRLWRSSAMPMEGRKEIVRLLVHHVEAKALRDAGRLDFEVHWTTGQVSRGNVRLRRRGEKFTNVRDSDVEIIHKMSGAYSDREIAQALGKLGRRAPDGVAWTTLRVRVVREEHGWPSPNPRSSEEMTFAEAQKVLHKGQEELRELAKRGKVKGAQAYPGTRWRFLRSDVKRTAQKRKPGKKGKLVPLVG